MDLSLGGFRRATNAKLKQPKDSLPLRPLPLAEEINIDCYLARACLPQRDATGWAGLGDLAWQRAFRQNGGNTET